VLNKKLKVLAIMIQLHL